MEFIKISKSVHSSNGNPIEKTFFNGWIDELRIWKSELTLSAQIRQMMNQEIQITEMSR
jgi:hypothetical protein